MADMQIAFAQDFLLAFARLPQKVQKKCSEFVTKFQNNPDSPGINFEHINNAAESGMRSVRLGDDYRGILLKPEAGNIYLLLWVDHHDEAYAWARRHRCRINTATGALQIYETVHVETEKPVEAPEDEPNERAAFAELRDRELLRLGVPEEHLELVRGVATEDDLDAIQAQLPREAYEGLFLFLAGSSYQQILNEREAAESITADDYAQALRRRDTRSRIVVPENETELYKMLAAPLEQWRVFLHPTQRRWAQNDKSGAVRVLGGAGTGKTVVAMHRANWLANNRADGEHKVLFTTFTRNLATDISHNLDSICSPENKKRIEVINLDAWVHRYLRTQNYEYQIIFPGSKKALKHWDTALNRKPAHIDLPDRFFQDEWLRVIQPQGIETLDQYKRASRVGRGSRLTRRQRMDIWPVFEEYRSQLTWARHKEVDDAYRDAATLISQAGQDLGYAGVIVDEAQDMSAQAFTLLRAIVPEGANDLFIVGDSHQRIYGRNPVVLSHCGINIVGRSAKLRINYRTTDEIRRWSQSVLDNKPVDDLDGGEDSTRGIKSLTHGAAPEIQHFPDSEAQNRFVIERLQAIQADDNPSSQLKQICITARTKAELDKIERSLDNAGIAYDRIEPNERDTADANAVRTATMHRVKGLEFAEMFIISANDNLLPLRSAMAACSDAVEKRRTEREERALLYVAATRARLQAHVLSYGQASVFLS